jgi:putative peptidoglycan lipid II flippase
VSVNALVLAGLIVGLANNVLIAALFGLGAHVDAFFAAAMLPNLFMVLCIDYLGKNFLPVLGAAREEGAACASRFTSSIVTTVAALALAVAALLAAFRAPLFGALLPGFDAEAIALVGQHFLIMAPSIVLMAINTFHEYVWQYERRYTYITASRLALPAANLVSLLLLAPWLGGYCLPVGYALGHATVFVLLVRRVPYRFRPSLSLRPQYERRVFANSAIVMSTGLIARSRSIILNYLASLLGSGAIAALALASKLTEPLERGAFTGIRLLLFGEGVRLVLAGDRRGLGTLYSMGLRAAFFLLAPVVWWIALNSAIIVETLLLRGEFTPDMAALLGAALVALLPSVLLLGCNQLLSNAFYAMNRVAVPALVMPLGTIAYAALAIPLSATLGVPGLAAATSAAAGLIFAALLVIATRAVPAIELRRTSAELALYVVLAGAAVFAAVVAGRALDLTPAAVALTSLPIGAGFYLGALLVGRDRTARALLALTRAAAARSQAAVIARSSRAPRVPKSD